MLAIIIIIPNTLGYKSTLLNLPYKLHPYLVFTYLSKITSNTPAKAKYLQFALFSPSPPRFCSYCSLCLEHSLTSPPGQFSWASYTFDFVSCFPGTPVAMPASVVAPGTLRWLRKVPLFFPLQALVSHWPLLLQRKFSRNVERGIQVVSGSRHRSWRYNFYQIDRSPLLSFSISL